MIRIHNSMTGEKQPLEPITPGQAPVQPLLLDRSRAAIGQRDDVCGFWLFPRWGGAG